MAKHPLDDKRVMCTLCLSAICLVCFSPDSCVVLRPHFVFCCLQVSVFFETFHSCSLLQEYGVTIYLRQRWCDPRLRHSKDIPLPPTSHYVSHLWLPDLIITNAKMAKFKDVTFTNRVVDIDQDGIVLYVSRLGLQLSCSMDFHRFPLDGQACEIEMESC